MEAFGISLSSEQLGGEYIGKEDFALGRTLDIFGRRIVLVKADAFTTNLLGLGDPVREVPVQKKSVTTSSPLGGRTHPTRKADDDGTVLRFLAQMEKGSECDRRFVIEYRPSDDSVAVFEKAVIEKTPSKFLERNIDHKGAAFRLDDLRAGRVCTINKFAFRILQENPAAKAFWASRVQQ